VDKTEQNRTSREITEAERLVMYLSGQPVILAARQEIWTSDPLSDQRYTVEVEHGE